MFDLFLYDFVVRGLIAGVVIAMIAPLVGIFLVLRRYSLIADTLSHVSLAGIALGLLIGINPLLSAIGATVVSSVLIEKLRLSKKVYGESALAIFLSGSLAVAVILISISHGFNSTLFNYLFGSIGTVATSDVITVSVLGIAVFIVVMILYKELFYISFSEDQARVGGINVTLINTIFIILSAATISIAIPVVGILLISALLVIPTVTALQFKKSFVLTIIIAQTISLFSTVSGVITSFYLNLSPGGTIVVICVLVFVVTEVFTNR